jgi:tetratricopeptide (TPR) repeat protein
MTRWRPTSRMLLICVLLAAGTLWAFWGVNNAEFASLDDPAYVSNNPIVQQGLTAENIKWALSTFYYSNWHPLTWLSYMADHEAFGLNPRGYHLVNLALHVANTLLLFLLLWRFTAAMWASAIVAAFFGWHPLHVESVAWISERKDVLSTLFWLLTMWAYGEYAKRRHPGWYAGMLILFVLGLMAKAMLVTLPFVLLLMDVWPLRRLELQAPGWLKETKRLVLEKLPLFAIAASASYVTFVAQAGAVRRIEEWMLTERFENALISYVRYLGKTFWPVDLAVFYPHPRAEWPGWQVITAASLLVIISLLTFIWARKRPYVFAGWWWFVGTLVPVIGIVQIGSQSIADRYMYVPSIGLFLLVVWGLRELTAAKRPRKVAASAITVAALISCGVLTARQVQHWKNDLTLFLHAERITPPNIVTLDHLITGLLYHGRTNEARARVRQVMAVAPHEYFTWWHAGNMFAAEGDLDKAIEHYQRGLHLNPDCPELNSQIGMALHKQGRFRDAIEHYRRAMERGGSQETEINLANALVGVSEAGSAVAEYTAMMRRQPDAARLHSDLGAIYVQKGQFEDAAKHLREAVRLKPDYGEAHLRLGMALGGERKFVEATEHLEKAAKLNPNDPVPHQWLALAWTELSDMEKVFAEYRQVIRLKPDLAPALNNLAWLLATNPEGKFRDGKAAVELAERACEITKRQQPVFVGTLAAAYAEAGRFEDAVTTAEQAMTLAKSVGQKEVVDKNRELLKLYRAGQPWREAPPTGGR